MTFDVMHQVSLGFRLAPLVIRHKEVLRHRDEPDCSEEERKRDRLWHDAHDILGDQLLLLQSICAVLSSSAIAGIYLPILETRSGGLTLVAR